MSKQSAMSRIRLALFVSPFLPMAAFLLPVTIFLPAFYVETVGIDFKLVGTIFLVAKLWDVVTDSLFGYLSDRYRTPWGRRRPWLLLAVPIMMVCSYMIFFPTKGATGYYLLTWLVLTYIGWTMLTLSHLSWSAELSTNYHERSRIQAWMKAFGVIGMLSVCLIPATIDNISALKDLNAINMMGIFVIVVIPVTVCLALFSTSETSSGFDRQTSKSTSIIEFFSALISNKPLLIVLGAAFFITLSNALFASMYIFYTKYVLQLGGFSSIALLLYFVAGFVCIPLWMSLSTRFEKQTIFRFVAVYGVISLLVLMAVPSQSIFWGTIAIFMMGANFAVMDILPKSMMADVTDVDLHNTKQSRSGLFFGMLLSTVKVANAVAVGISFWVLSMIGFEPKLDNPDDVTQNFTLFFVFAPIMANLVVLYLLSKYPLTEQRQAKIRAKIREIIRADKAA